MDNDIKLDEEKAKKILQSANELKKSGKLNSNELINKNLSPSQAAKFKELLKDPNTIKSILSTPIAEKIKEKFAKGLEE